jgi:hypothetical protein
MTAVSLDMAYRSFREVLAGSTPASMRRLQSNVATQIPAYLAALQANAGARRIQSGSSCAGASSSSSTFAAPPEQAGMVEIEFATGGRMRITGSVDA